jgi:TfoX/Sxy family transcriptional regulator of competence genes
MGDRGGPACHHDAMAFDEDLAHRVRGLLGQEAELSEKRMFGGLAMLLGGHMAVVIRGRGGLMVRVCDADTAKAEAEPGAQLAQMRGRPMTGWYIVTAETVATAGDLRRWVTRGVRAARAQPAKQPW